MQAATADGAAAGTRTAQLLQRHVEALVSCRRCPQMHRPAVSGGPIVSKIILVGQAPGDKEPILGRPFAWTAGRTLFHWFEQACGLDEAQFRASIYMAAVCRCFPGKKAGGGDRVPSRKEIGNCARWFDGEVAILNPALVIPVGRLAIDQFLATSSLNNVVGRQFRVHTQGQPFDLIPLPHPSGASPWHRMEPGRTLLSRSLRLIGEHPALREIRRSLGHPRGDA